jgi:hypothetical protein
MWFDPHAMRAKIVGHPPATSATTATQAQPARPVSQMSRLSQPLYSQKPVSRVAEVASVATPLVPKPEPPPNAEIFPHGTAFDGRPKTWTGCIVSLDTWRNLTEWEKHGPNGRHWNGITQTWEAIKLHI